MGDDTTTPTQGAILPDTISIIRFRKMGLSMISLSCAIVLLTICTLTLTTAIDSFPRLAPERSPLSIQNCTKPSAVESAAFLDLAAATKSLNTKSLNINGKHHAPRTEMTIAAGAFLMMLILGIDKTLNKSCQAATLQEPASQAPTSRAAEDNSSSQATRAAEDNSSSQATFREPRGIGTRRKKPFPNSATCCPIPEDINTNNTWSDPVTGEVFNIPQDRPTSRTGRKRVTFADVHVRELEWEPDETCCEHGIPHTWHCTIGAHYSFSVDSAVLHRQTSGRLHKQEYCWTSHKRCGPKLECEHCKAPAMSPPSPPPSSPERKALGENELSLGSPDNIVAPDSRAKTVAEMYFQEKLRFFS